MGAQALDVHYADIVSPIITPPDTFSSMNEQPELSDGQCANSCYAEENNAAYCIGGLTWLLPVGRRMEDYLIFYVGSDDPAFVNILMTYNACEIGVGLLSCLQSSYCLPFNCFAVKAVFQIH